MCCLERGLYIELLSENGKQNLKSFQAFYFTRTKQILKYLQCKRACTS